ncbi:MAG: bifunctional precorrin-2 dehydrogenase/sirohydrochlorin ferrochelatase [Candidatus Kuenenia stuttgartiensis]|nr:bifunctional precorrin-2 dehydrogenase/sirohydrochlorin ferrochelatase [Candidatus Kuenenia stuttgartiensis]
MSKYYPAQININNKKCVVVGGGNVAWRKVCSLKNAGAKVVVVSPVFCPEMEREEGIELVKQKYDEYYLNGAVIVIASTDDEKVNEKVYHDAVRKGMLVNVVDKPDYCSFIVPSSIVRGDLCITISTGGSSPAFVRNIRLHLEKQFGNEYSEFTELLSEMRRKVLGEISDEKIRRGILQRIAEWDMFDFFKEKGASETRNKMLNIISGKHICK